MSTEIFLHGSEDGDTGPVLLASGAGWTDFGNWAKGLDGFDLLRQLVDDGEVKDTLQLANELGQARDESPIGDPNTDDVAVHLLDTLGIGDPEEFATVLESGEELPVKESTFAETPEIPGRDQAKAEQLLSAALRQGAAKLQAICRAAVERHGEGILDAQELFSEEERQELADQIAATNATAELLGRARIREREAAVMRRHEFAEHRFCERCGDEHAFAAGEPCKRGETSAKTGCIPASKGGAATKAAPPKTAPKVPTKAPTKVKVGTKKAAPKGYKVKVPKAPPKPKAAPKAKPKEKATPKEAAKPPPKIERGEAAKATQDRVMSHAASAAPAQKKAYADALNKMPDGAIERLGGGLEKVTFHENTADLTKAKAGLGGDAEAVDGVYFFREGHMMVDGKTRSDMMSKAGKASYGTYSHEMGHAIDRGREEVSIGEDFGMLSDTPEWNDAWESEIWNKNARAVLSEYARTQPSEGFAETCRLLYGPDTTPKQLATAERNFPKTFAFFRKHGLWT